jgi:hypothetical protein
MKMPRRELRLLVITVGVVLLAGTYMALEGAIAEFGAYGQKLRKIEERAQIAQHLLDSRPQVEAQVEEFLELLPSYPEGRKPDSTLMPALESLAGDLLTRREIGAEELSETVRNLYETAITCHWDGTLERLVKFLWDQQSQGVASDMRQLSVQTGGGGGGGASKKGRLSGRFTVHYAYRRTPADAAGGGGSQSNPGTLDIP